MPQAIRSLWFEEISFIHEKFFDTPIGKLTVRQVAIVFVFGVSAWAAFNSVGDDDMLKVAVTSLLVILALAFAFQRIKTLTPEQSMMFALFAPKTSTGRSRRIKKNTNTPISTLSVDVGQQKGSETFDISVLDASDNIQDGQIQKLVVLVRDPQTGHPLPNRGCGILVDSERIGRRLTDEEGFLTIPFVPKQGINTIEVKPEGYAAIVKNVTVDVHMRQQGEQLRSSKTAQVARK
ncbi:hypothetical protein Ngar_c06640 [Candidatus Nitrososphaera gargensis Ga9.2]|uniref:Carboxypeptidase regulatory-like domain-containing protein n=1 Tax=Nitrososphaera gargensis (strain Ga9.2) TaxID=1237085 RepID=K0II13_NITGG|nr:hypothetical protein [Candidatus Nitrososphaera gargensis]AFU57607.1 hypothetical protein Ngar_c06640 [Candidatus Nitrososphaera gargensis Ga9.2]